MPSQPYQIFNPKTNRTIKNNSSSIIKLIKDNEFIIQDKKLIPINKDKYSYSIQKKQWYLNEKLDKRYTHDANHIITLKPNLVFNITGRIIKENSRSYKKLINIGYYHNKDSHQLFKSNKINFYDGGIAEIDDIWTTYDIIKIFYEDNSFKIIRGPWSSRHILKDILFEFSYNDDSRMVFLEAFHLGKNKFGPQFNSLDEDKNCLIDCLRQSIKSKVDWDQLYNEYEFGVFEDDIEHICDKLKIQIIIYMRAYDNESYIYGSKYKKVIKLHSNNNHCSLYTHKNDLVKLEIKYVDEIESYLPNINNISTFIKSDKILLLKADGIEYRLKEYNNIQLEDTNFINDISYFKDLFLQKNNKFKTIIPNHENIDVIKKLCQHGLHFQNSSEKSDICLDLKSAYSNSENFDEFDGYPSDLSISISTENLSKKDIQNILDTKAGFVLIECIDIFSYKYRHKYITRLVSIPYLKWRMTIENPKILAFLLAFEKIESLNLSMFNKNRDFHKVLGSLSKKNTTQSTFTHDPVEAQFLGIYSKLEYGEGKIIYDCIFQEDKISSKTYMPHLVSYIQNYTEIQIEKMMIKLYNNDIQINRIMVDGIGITNQDYKKINFDIDLKLWHIKDVNVKEFYNVENTYKNIVEFDDIKKISNEYIDIIQSDLTCIQGAAGTGKSYHLKILYKQICNPIILCPNHKLLQNYKDFKNDTVDGLIANKFSQKYNTLLIDEYSMVSDDKINKLLENNPNIILFGDDKQLQIYKGKKINLDNFHIHILYENKRQDNIEFINKINITRDTGDISWITNKNKDSIEDAVKDAVKNNHLILASTHKNINKINEIALTKLKDTNKIIYFKNDIIIYENMPIRCIKTKKTKKFMICCGDIFTITSIINNNMILNHTLEIDIKYFKYFTLGFCSTIHSIQGLTIKDQNVSLLVDNLFCKEMAYIFVSRVVNEKQLYIIN